MSGTDSHEVLTGAGAWPLYPDTAVLRQVRVQERAGGSVAVVVFAFPVVVPAGAVLLVTAPSARAEVGLKEAHSCTRNDLHPYQLRF